MCSSCFGTGELLRSPACPFCDRVNRGEFKPAGDWAVVSFEPLNPVASGHRLFLPRRHQENAGSDPPITGRVFEAAARWATERQVAFNLITSAGAAATQTVSHLHVHYVPRRAGDGLHLPWTGQEEREGRTRRIAFDKVRQREWQARVEAAESSCVCPPFLDGRAPRPRFSHPVNCPVYRAIWGLDTESRRMV